MRSTRSSKSPCFFAFGGGFSPLSARTKRTLSTRLPTTSSASTRRVSQSPLSFIASSSAGSPVRNQVNGQCSNASNAASPLPSPSADSSAEPRRLRSRCRLRLTPPRPVPRSPRLRLRQPQLAPRWPQLRLRLARPAPRSLRPRRRRSAPSSRRSRSLPPRSPARPPRAPHPRQVLPPRCPRPAPLLSAASVWARRGRPEMQLADAGGLPQNGAGELSDGLHGQGLKLIWNPERRPRSARPQTIFTTIFLWLGELSSSSFRTRPGASCNRRRRSA